MKKVFISLLIIIMCFAFFVPVVLGVSEIEEKVNYYLYDTNYSNYILEKNSELHTTSIGGANQPWIHGLYDLAKYLNSKSESELAEGLKNNADLMKVLKEILIELPNLAVNDENDFLKQMHCNANEIRLAIGSIQGDPFKNTNDRGISYVQFLKEAYNRIESASITNAGDYVKKFCYNRESIKQYIKEHSDNNNYGLSDYKQKQNLEKVWRIKYNADPTSSIATRTDLYVDQYQHDTNTMMNYDIDKIKLYKTLWGLVFPTKTNTEYEQIKQAWSKTVGSSIEDLENLEMMSQKDYEDIINYFKGNVDARWEDLEEEAKKQDQQFVRDNFVEQYALPRRTGSINGDESSKDIDTIIDSGNQFVKKADKANDKEKATISESSIKDMSNAIYNILLIVGVIIAVIVGAIIGIKFMTGSIEEKANIKELLFPYIIGCIVVFGAFGIWKIAVLLLKNI